MSLCNLVIFTLTLPSSFSAPGAACATAGKRLSAPTGVEAITVAPTPRCMRKASRRNIDGEAKAQTSQAFEFMSRACEMGTPPELTGMCEFGTPTG